MAQRFPVLARGSGRWIGTYTHLDPTGGLVDEHEVETDSEFPADGAADFRLRIHNRWRDGRESQIEPLADYRNDRLEWRERLVGWMNELDEQTVYLNFTYASDPSLRVCEMIQVSPDGMSRARTWHWFRDDRLFKVTLAREKRADA
ncbi:hypothetical protein AWL63_15775 [Sphingomonas panacis]|uniref:DUF3598 domain-containing protein n=1 Tax=Sphingomonas panacis TaxID=1560345 RepID=A0A1B3ZCP9_9SPHN|nr:hypothetical protein [Sphingomonas panacis]AOH85199.1 hypothetical protein AWL63_15775 [Sphingomonas panacis]